MQPEQERGGQAMTLTRAREILEDMDAYPGFLQEEARATIARLAAPPKPGQRGFAAEMFNQATKDSKNV